MIPAEAVESEREELCALISEAVGGWNAATRAITHVADVLLAAGYRKVQK